MTSEELQNLVESNAKAIQSLANQQTEIFSNNREDIQILIEGQARLQDVQADLAETQGQLALTQEVIAEAVTAIQGNEEMQTQILRSHDQILRSLAAGQEKQDRILDYLMSRDANS